MICVSLRTADVFPVVASLPPRILLFLLLLFFEGREAMIGNTSSVRMLDLRAIKAVLK